MRGPRKKGIETGLSPDVAEKTGTKDALRQFINLNKGS